MADKPTVVPLWAMDNVVDPLTGIPNVQTPPIEKQNNGWILQFPPRQWFNWLARYTAEWILWLKQQEEQNIVTNGDGVGLFPTDGALITLTAIDSTTPANYIYAVGYKGAGVDAVLNVIDSNGLTLGTPTITGDFPITGGTPANVIVYGNSKVIPS